MNDSLVIGTQDIAPKDQMVLRSLVRLLKGSSSIHARFSEQLGECNVVFVPGCGTHRLQAPCVAVRVHETAPAGDASAQTSDLAVLAPLRMSNVMATLQMAAQRVHGVARVDPVRSLQALFTLLSESTRTAERRRAVVPLGCGQQIVFDFVNQLVHTATPLEVLFSGAYMVGTSHRVSPVEEELIRLEPSHSLRHVVWGLSLRLAQAHAAAPERLSRYQLRRWPDAVGLAVPGHPRLAALWTRSPLSLEQIRTTSGVPEATTRWFLEACLALDLVADHGASLVPHLAPAPAQASSSSAPVPSGWFGHLRERFKLW